VIIVHVKRNGKAPQIYLRCLAPSDFEELSARHVESVRHLRGFVNTKFTREDFAKTLADGESETKEPRVICRRSDSSIVGRINLNQIFRGPFQNAYLGYYLFAGFTGKGYMTEAIGLILNVAFSDLNLHRVEANVQPQNVRSIELLKRCGFSKEGYSPRYLKIGGKWRDHERWAIVREYRCR